MAFEQLHSIVCQIHRHIRVVTEIIGKILFNDILFVSTANDKLLDVMCGIYFHDMPKYRFTANLNHWLWHILGLFTETSAKTSCKNYSFHILNLIINSCLFITTELSGTSLYMMHPAPITQLSPIVTPFRIVMLLAIQQCLPITIEAEI